MLGLGSSLFVAAVMAWYLRTKLKRKEMNTLGRLLGEPIADFRAEDLGMDEY